jgi:hypothetical protein
MNILLYAAERISQESFYPISFNGSTDFSADRETDTRMPASVLPCQEEQMRAMSLFCLRKYLGKFMFAPKAVVLGQSFRPLARRRLITNCPLAVFILLRKPWVLLRRILLG